MPRQGWDGRQQRGRGSDWLEPGGRRQFCTAHMQVRACGDLLGHVMRSKGTARHRTRRHAGRGVITTVTSLRDGWFPPPAVYTNRDRTRKALQLALAVVRCTLQGGLLATRRIGRFGTSKQLSPPSSMGPL